MQCPEVIESIHQIYDILRTPYNIREHQIQAASLGALLCDSWMGEPLDRDLVVATLLVHDLGNTVRMDLESEVGLSMLGAERTRVGYWRQVKEETIERYGAKDHEVTDLMLAEVGADKRIRDLLDRKKQLETMAQVRCEDMDLSAVVYADGRIGPFGVLTLQERHRDLQERAAKRGYKRDDLDPLFAWLFKVEKEFFSHTMLCPDNITGSTLHPYINSFSREQPG